MHAISTAQDSARRAEMRSIGTWRACGSEGHDRAIRAGGCVSNWAVDSDGHYRAIGAESSSLG